MDRRGQSVTSSLPQASVCQVGPEALYCQGCKRDDAPGRGVVLPTGSLALAVSQLYYEASASQGTVLHPDLATQLGYNAVAQAES